MTEDKIGPKGMNLDDVEAPSTLTDAKFTSGMLDEAYNQGIVDSIKTVKICFNNNIKYVGPVSDLRDRLIQSLELLKKK